MPCGPTFSRTCGPASRPVNASSACRSTQYLASHPAVGALFDRTMASAVRYRHRPAVDAYDFGQFRTIVDVGGGNGALMVETSHEGAERGHPHEAKTVSASMGKQDSSLLLVLRWVV